MVKSFAQRIEGEWLQSPNPETIRNASHRFNGEADPLYNKSVEANHKSEAERRAEHSSGDSESSGDTALRKREASKPVPVLKPRSQQGRGQDRQAQWLNTEYQEALRTTKSRPSSQTVPNQSPSYQLGISQSR